MNYFGAETFYRDTLAAARKVGRRAVLLVGDRVDPLLGEGEGGGESGGGEGGDFLVRRYVPHSLVFPRAAVVVHQGGVGTLAQAMRAGRPELVVPFYGDQFDNADRAARLGVGRSISFRRYGIATAAQALERLLGDRKYEERARDVAAQVMKENGAQRAAELVRRFLDHGTIAQ